MKKDLYRAYIAVGLVSFFWGTTYIAAQIGAQQMPGLYMAALRQFFSGIILVAFFLARGYKLPSIRILKEISIQGIFLLCIANGLLTWSVEYISGGLAAIIVALAPLFIALFSILFSKCATITRNMVAGLMIGFAGVLMIFSDYTGELGNNRFVIGVVLAFISVVAWAFGSVYSSHHKSSLSILFNVGLQMLIAGIIMLVICGVTGKYVNIATSGWIAWIALLYLVVFGSLIAYTAYVFAISKLPPTQVSVYAYINPVVAAGLGYLLLSEKVNLIMIAGMIITLAGVFVVNREFNKVKR